MIEATINRIIVKVVYKDVSSIIIVPEGVRKRLDGFHGEVVAIGPNFPHRDVRIGSRIMFTRDEGVAINTEKEEYLSLDEDRVLAIINDEDKP